MRFFDVRLRLALTALLILSPNLLSASASAQGLFDFLGGGGAPRHTEQQGPPPAAPPPPVKKKPVPAKTDKPAAATQAQQKTPKPVVSDAPPPYESQLLRLTEMIGALAYLRDLCGAADGDEWRAKMTALLNAEAPSGSRRDKLSSSFNRGFRGYELTYRACTPNAQAVIVRYVDETGRISQDIAYRYGNP